MELLKNENNFKEELESNDFDRITEGLLKKLNKVADTLAPSQRLQICKSRKSCNCEEAKKLYREAKEAKLRAFATKDPEEQRQVQNKAAVAARKNYAAEIKEIKENIDNPKFKWKMLNYESAED